MCIWLHLAALTPCCQDGPSHRPTRDGVPGVLFPSQTYQTTVNSGEKPTPHSKAPCKTHHGWTSRNQQSVTGKH